MLKLRALLGRLGGFLSGSSELPLDTSLFSWVLPLCARELPLARRAIRSLRRQTAGRWELLLVPHGPGSRALAAFLKKAESAGYAQVLPAMERESLAHAYRDGTRAARGEWVGYLRPESRLAPEALLWLAQETADHPEAAWVYSDEAFRLGRRTQANYKPEFSLWHLWSQPFTGQLSIYRRSALADLDLPTAEFGAAWQHDLGLRLAERCRADQIRHIPVALHETVLPPGPLEPFLRLTPAHHAATQAALARRAVNAELTGAPGLLNLPRIHFRPSRTPPVAIVIPTRDHAELLLPCIRSLRENTQYPNFELIVIDNHSQEPQLLAYLAAESAHGRLRVHRYDHPFNHSAMHNEVLHSLNVEHVVLLNNDVDEFSPGWLEELVGTIELDPRIATVGAQLRFPDHTIQHAGVLLLDRGGPNQSHYQWPSESDGYFGRLQALQDYSACTAAALMVRLQAFRAVGGFDAARFPTSYNDVDLCLRLGQAGYRCLYNPSVQARHLESKTRGIPPGESEYRRVFRGLWQSQLAADPYYNRNLSSERQFVESRPSK